MCSPSKDVKIPEVKSIVFHRVGNCERVKCQFKFPQNCKKPIISQYKYDFSNMTRTKSRRPINYCFHKGAFHIYRYENPEHLNAMLKFKTIAFIRPKLWKDPFEAIFYKPCIKIKGEIYDVACICVKYDWVVGEEAAWQSYGKTGQIVRVEYNFAKYTNLLNIIGGKYDVYFYISVVDYSIRRSEIASLYYKMNGQFHSIEEYLTYLSLKREAFSHENELRIFAVKKGGSFEDNPNGIINFNFNDIIGDQEIIKYVSGTNDNNSILITEVALPPNKNEIIKLKSTINKIYPDFSFYQSKLYDTST